MKKTGIGVLFLLLMAVLIAPSPNAYAATAAQYSVTETSYVRDLTDRSRTSAPTPEYDYVYGDDASLTFTLPWPFTFYGNTYSRIDVDTNGNVWFSATGAAHSLDLTNTGRGPVIAAWNNDLSSYFYGGVFVQHKRNPERVVIEWQTETYTDEGASRINEFGVVLYPNGVIRADYGTFNPSAGKDFGSGISRGDGTVPVSLTSTYGNIFSLSGRSFLFASGKTIFNPGPPPTFVPASPGTPF